MSCASSSKTRTGQPWDKPGHDGRGSGGATGEPAVCRPRLRDSAWPDARAEGELGAYGADELALGSWTPVCASVSGQSRKGPRRALRPQTAAPLASETQPQAAPKWRSI